MAFLRQMWTLTRKSLLIVVVRGWFSTFLVALLGPIIFVSYPISSNIEKTLHKSFLLQMIWDCIFQLIRTWLGLLTLFLITRALEKIEVLVRTRELTSYRRLLFVLSRIG